MMKVFFIFIFFSKIHLEASTEQLMIGGPEAWTALAIREDTSIAQMKAETAPKPKQKQKGGKKDKNSLAIKRRGKGRKAKRTSGPKVWFCLFCFGFFFI